ncbi:caspase domain-containing protein [Abortiporus biennis]|nr:caspase domain-containing protein [Abortiporus biennis]
MWNDYPGSNRGGYPPPPGQPPMGFPSPNPGGYGPSPGPPPSSGYQPGYGGPPPPPGGWNYGPPPGPPPPPSGGYGFPEPGSFAPPPGPPPQGFPSPQGPPPIPPRDTYDTRGHQHQHQHHHQGQGVPPPQSSYNPSYGTGTPNQYPGGYAPPAGPPPRPPVSQQYYGPSFEGANHQQNQHAFFQYSQCTGKRKALCIGINYIRQPNELKGCINDANNVKRFLIEFFHYKPEDIVILTDDSQNPRQIPTKANMIEAMRWLTRDARPNDALFFHYAGHGGQTKDLDGDEADGYDETIYPVDFEKAGQLTDDMMHDLLVKPLPAGCRLTAIFDSCHSGSALDLPYIYSTEGKIKEPNLVAEAGQGLLSAFTSYSRGDMGGVFQSVTGIIKTASGSSSKAEKKTRATKTSPADVISWSGCKDKQTSADAFEAGQSTGAMSYAFVNALRKNPSQSYQQLLISLRDFMKGKYSQKPQLSSSHPIDTSLLFIC